METVMATAARAVRLHLCMLALATEAREDAALPSVGMRLCRLVIQTDILEGLVFERRGGSGKRRGAERGIPGVSKACTARVEGLAGRIGVVGIDYGRTS